MWTAVCAMIQTSLQIDETEFMAGSDHTRVRALIAGALVGRWAARVLLASRQPPRHHQHPTSPIPPVILHPSAVKLRFKMNSGRDLLLRRAWPSQGDGEEKLIGKAVCKSPGCSVLMQCRQTKSSSAWVTSKKLYNSTSVLLWLCTITSQITKGIEKKGTCNDHFTLIQIWTDALKVEESFHKK